MDLRQLFRRKDADAPDMANDPTTVPQGGLGGGRMMNNRPLLIGGLVIAGFLGIVGHVIMQRSAEQAQQEQEDAKKPGPSAAGQARDVTGPYGQGGLIAPDLPPKEEPAAAPAASTGAPDVQLPPLPASRTPAVPSVRAARPEESAVWNTRFQALQAGLRARTRVQVADQGGAAPVRAQRASASASNDVTAAYQARLAQIRGQMPESASAPDARALSGGGRTDNSLGQFDRANAWELKQEVQAPSSYELRAGFVIPAIMISGISSDLPGQVMAQVSQNVFDTATGRHLLIPQGTRLIGTYNSSVAYGQQRILMAWQRLVFPDGKALDIGAMPGADSAGYGGFNDQVNNHYLRIFGSSLLLSGVVAAVALSQDRGGSDNESNRQRAGDALSEALGQTMGSTMSEMLRKNLNISPTLEIRPGYRFNVMVVKDMRFREPYRAFSY